MNKEFRRTEQATNNNKSVGNGNKRNRLCRAIGSLLLVISLLLKDSAFCTTDFGAFITDVIQGMSIGLLFVGLIMSSRYGARICSFKNRILGK